MRLAILLLGLTFQTSQTAITQQQAVSSLEPDQIKGTVVTQMSHCTAPATCVGLYKFYFRDKTGKVSGPWIGSLFDGSSFNNTLPPTAGTWVYDVGP